MSMEIDLELVTTSDLDNYVPKQDGKDLSTNDFTNDLKTKLDNIESEANKTEILNVLTSDKTTSALSANQGKILNDKLTGLGQITYDDTNKELTIPARFITYNATEKSLTISTI